MEQQLLMLKLQKKAINQQIKALKKEIRKKHGWWGKRVYKKTELGFWNLVDRRKETLEKNKTSSDELIAQINQVFDAAEEQLSKAIKPQEVVSCSQQGSV